MNLFVSVYRHWRREVSADKVNLVLTCVSVGLEEEGIYRKPGVLSKASALMKDCIGT